MIPRRFGLLFLALGVTLLISPRTAADDWPQWLGPQRDGIWREKGILEKFPADGPKVRWKRPVGPGYAGPAVADGRVYLTDRIVAEGKANPGDPFAKGRIPGRERVLCLAESDGKIIWVHEYDSAYQVSYPAGPRATPAVDGSRVYTLGAMGDLVCLETASGQVRWQRDLKKDYKTPAPMWGFAGHPLVDGKKLICLVGGEGSVVVAFNKEDGKEIWRALTATEPGYAPPMIYEAGGKRQLILWHPESINGLDPETGRVFWSQPFAVRSGLSVPTPRKENDLLLVSCFYNGSMMLKLRPNEPAADLLWRGQKNDERNTDTLHSIISTPFLDEGYIYGVCSYGEFRCLKAATGERLWETLEPTTGKKERWGNAFLVKQGRRYFLFNEKGDLIMARLTPEKYEEISRAHLLDPVNTDPGRPVVWSHPAFANRCFYGRNDREIICVSLAAD